MSGVAKTAVVYARFSTDKQDPRSIEDQIRRCRVLADQRGWHVVGDYADAASSGSHTDRINLKRLLRDATRGDFQLLLVDDLSRLSRDLGATWRIIFEDLGGAGINVVDCSTGRASNDIGARLEIGIKALLNDQYLEQIRRQTHRGLEGRALAGFHTGGKTYGFRTVPEPKPADIFHPRKVRVIEENEAKVVLRIFRMAADGRAPRAIAIALNEERVPAPHDGGKGHKKASGWCHSTIRHMLRNENYIGTFVWNRHRFEQKPSTNSYRHVPRPEEDHIRKEFPDLRIVPQDLWDTVQAVLGTKKSAAAGTTRLGTSSRPSAVFSGLLKCGMCGGSLSIVSQRRKNGVAYGRLGCGINRSRGPKICLNTGTLSELRVVNAVLGELRTRLSDPQLADHVLAGVEEHMNATAKNDILAELGRQVASAELRRKNVIESLAHIGFSEGLHEQLAIEEESVATARKKFAAAKADSRPRVLAHPVLKRAIEQMRDVLTSDEPGAAKALLRRHMPPLVVMPVPGGYNLSGAFGISLKLLEGDEKDLRREIRAVGGTGIEPATRRV